MKRDQAGEVFLRSATILMRHEACLRSFPSSVLCRKDVVKDSARNEYESAKFEKDPEIVSFLLDQLLLHLEVEGKASVSVISATFLSSQRPIL